MTTADFNNYVQALSEFEANVDKNSLSDLDNTGCEIYNDEVKALWTEIKLPYKSVLRVLKIQAKTKEELAEIRAYKKKYNTSIAIYCSIMQKIGVRST